MSLDFIIAGPPGQVASIAGKKAGFKQGELGGILKELGYTEDQVRLFLCLPHL
jgi:cytochrome-b5 reductase